MSSSQLRRMTVIGVRVHVPIGEVVVLLRPEVVGALEAGLVLPITIGPREGAAIASVLAGIEPPRPQTHDLLLDTIRTLGHEVTQVAVLALVSGVFFAEITLTGGHAIDARASDAIALALRAHAPILCDPQVLADAGLVLDDGELADDPDDPDAHAGAAGPGGPQPPVSESDVAQFRAFLDSVEPEDFDDADS